MRPWKWVVNPKHHGVELSEGSHGNLVMVFRRWGMGSATPLFNVDGIMVPAHQLTKLEPGREHHAEWWRLVDHPAARLIEASPVLLEALKKLVHEAEGFIIHGSEVCGRDIACDEADGEPCDHHGNDGCPSCACGVAELQAAAAEARLALALAGAR